MRAERHSFIGQSRSDHAFDIVNILLMISILFGVAYPLFFVVIASISDPAFVAKGEVLFWPKGISFLGYEKILDYQQIMTGYLNTIWYTLVGTVLGVILTISSGYALSRKDLKGRNLFLIIFTVTLFINGGLIPTYLLVKNLGLRDSFWAMIIPSAVSVFNVLIAKSFYEGGWIDELLGAALIDGCNDLGFFFRIAMPLSTPLVAVMVLFYAVGKWNSFFDALIYLDSAGKYPLQLVLRDILMVNQANMGGIVQDVSGMVDRVKAAELVKYGVIVVSSIPMLILYPFIQKYFIKGVMLGAIKG